MEEKKIESPQEEIEMLKKRIAEIETVGKERPEIIKEAIKEHIEKVPEEILADGRSLSPEEIKEMAERIKVSMADEEPHQRQVLELLQIAQDKGILNAVSIVKYIDDPHLEDDFHDALIRYFQTLENV